MVNTYVTEELLGDFGGGCSERLLEVLDVSDGLKSQQETIICQVFIEILIAYEKNQIELNELIQFLVLGIKNDNQARIFCQVIDVLPITTKIDELLQLIVRKDCIKVSTISSYISSDSLKNLTIIPKQSLIKSLNIKKRDQFYTQKKYNLIHEQSEGFSKLVVEIYQIFKKEDCDYQLNYAINVIETLIGHYSLDPNKCLDILLEIYSVSFISRINFAKKLLQKSRWWPSTEGDISNLSNLNIGGNQTASKILGLKLLKYPHDKDIPETYKILISWLIKIGFISFGSIYKYLSPNDNDMETLQDLYKKRLNDKVSKAGANALALAAPLLDDDDDNEKSKGDNNSNNNESKKQSPINEDEEFQNKIKFNMKFQILRTLLSCGAYWPSIFILTKYPFLAYVDDEISSLMNRVYDAMIQPLYNEVKPFTNEQLIDFQTPKKIAIARPQNHVVYSSQNTIELFSFNPNIKSYGQKKFIYFYTNWNENLPIVNSISQLFQTSNQFLKFVGTNLSKNLPLFIKICEIGYEDLKKNQANQELKDQWFHYFRNFIFPAMCVIEENSIAIEKAYSMLSFYSVEERFSVYGELYQILAKNNPRIKIAYNKAEKSTKDVLKRLSKENVRPMMRRLAKISFSNPLPCLLTILQQIESYDNLNSLVVETARYFNRYAWDTLTVAILIRLTATGRATIQANGIFERQWIQSLASFIGKICQRYPNSIDIRTILEFLLKSFHSGDRVGLIVFKEILSSMGGMQSITNLTLHQIDLINCGSSLQKIVYRVISDVRYSRIKPGSILVKTIIELNAINEFLVLLSQIKQEINESDELEHLKVLANKNDDLDAVINLFTTLVTFFGTLEQIEENLLSITELCNEYQVPIQVAFQIWRPLLSKRSDTGRLNDLKENLPSILSPTVLEYLTLELFITFWQLSLYDINYSDDLYQSELDKLKISAKSLKTSISMSSRDKKIARSSIEKSKSDLKTIEEFIDKIPQDKEKHLEHNSLIGSRLSDESLKWFRENVTVNDSMQYFLQYCILPRAVHSSFDALYAGRFLFKLHELNAKNFSLISLLDKLIKSKILFATLFTSTTTESENLGIFFAEVLGKLHKWFVEAEFNREANNEVSILKDANGDVLTYDQYRTTLYSYHNMILEDIGNALSADEYMCRRNSITFLKNLVGVYPNVEDHCEKFAELIQHIITTEDREDLKLSSSALMGHLKSRSSGWVHLWDFIPLSDELKEEHMNKRKEKKERIAQEKRKKEEEKRKAEEVKIAKAAEEKQRKLKATMNYESEQSINTQRPDSRNVGSSGRYDNYSNYKQSSDVNTKDSKISRLASTKDDVQTKDKLEDNSKVPKEVKPTLKVENPADAKPERKSNEPVDGKVEDRKKFEVVKKDEETKRINDEKKVERDLKLDDEKKAVDIKAKLLQARKEFAATTDHRVSTNDRFGGDKSRSRTPLPDQSDYSRSNTKNPGTTNSARNSKYNRHNYDREVSDSAPLPPPPPPPPPPPVSRQKGNYGYQGNRNSRFGSKDHSKTRDNTDDKDMRDLNYKDSRAHLPRTYDKRKNDGYGPSGRHYDKRQKY